jgi:hypothetical protein
MCPKGVQNAINFRRDHDLPFFYSRDAALVAR